MFGNFVQWFTALPIYFQAVGYLLLLPFALMALGVLIIFFDQTAAKELEDKNAFVGLMRLGGLGAIFLFPLFGVTLLCSSVFQFSYGLSVGIGLVFGLVIVPAVLIFLSNRN